MSYGVQYPSGTQDPYNRPPSPYQRAPSPYQRAPSPGGFLMQQQQQQFSQPPFSPVAGAQITPGTITYTTKTGPDGKLVYCPFRAVAASYQTPQGIVSGIQWVPAEATAVLPPGAMPASAEFMQSWQRPESQREEEKRHRREDKEAARREKERHKREKAEERDIREARERERRDRGGGISRPGSPYGAPIPTGRISPYAPPAQLPRSGSPYHSGGGLPSAGRPVSPYRSGGALPARPVSPYHSGTTIRSSSPYQGGGPLPNVGRPVSPYQAGGALPGNVYGSGYISNQTEIERKMADLGIGSKSEHDRRRKMSVGNNSYAVAPGGNYPNTGYSSVHSAANSATNTGGYPYGATSPSVGQFPAHDGRPRSRAPSPSPYGHHSPNAFPQQLNEQGMLPQPEGFSRPPNAAQSYPNFENMKIQDMDDFMDHIPRMPLVLVPHDVYHEDWIRLMTDLASAWVGRLPIPDSARSTGRGPKRTVVTSDLVDVWNASFFIPRGVEIVLYKGRERRSGRLAGQVDMNLPGFDDRYDEASSSDSEESEDSNSEDDVYSVSSSRYGSASGIYGRQSEGQIAELREAKRRRKEMQEDQKRRRKEKKARKRVRELERKYSIYLTCAPLPPSYH